MTGEKEGRGQRIHVKSGSHTTFIPNALSENKEKLVERILEY